MKKVTKKAVSEKMDLSCLNNCAIALVVLVFVTSIGIITMLSDTRSIKTNSYYISNKVKEIEYNTSMAYEFQRARWIDEKQKAKK